MAASSQSLLHEAMATNSVRIVNINEVVYMPIGAKASTLSRATIGARGLGACSVVLITSNTAVIMAHIGPNVDLKTKDLDSHIALADAKMREVKTRLEEHRDDFQTGAVNYVAYATFGGEPTSREQLQRYRQWIQVMGLANCKEHSYERPKPSAIVSNSASGTLWVDGRGPAPRVYLEDRPITMTIWGIDHSKKPPRFVERAAGNVVMQETEQPPPRTWITIVQNGKPVRRVRYIPETKQWETEGKK